MAGLPAPDIGRVLGLTQPEPPRMWSFDRGPGGNNADATHTSAEAPSTEDTKAVVFCTYAGGIREAYSTLAVEKQYLECLRLKIVGQFSCPGGEISHMAVDQVSAIMGVQVEKAAPLVQKYKTNPNDIYFKKLTPEQHQQMAEAVADKRDMPDYPGMEGFIAPKYDLSNRPNQNDLQRPDWKHPSFLLGQDVMFCCSPGSISRPITHMMFITERFWRNFGKKNLIFRLFVMPNALLLKMVKLFIDMEMYFILCPAMMWSYQVECSPVKIS